MRGRCDFHTGVGVAAAASFRLFAAPAPSSWLASCTRHGELVKSHCFQAYATLNAAINTQHEMMCNLSLELATNLNAAIHTDHDKILISLLTNSDLNLD